MIKINKVDRLKDSESGLRFEHLKIDQFFVFGDNMPGLRLRTEKGHMDLKDGQTYTSENFLMTRVELVDVEINWRFK